MCGRFCGKLFAICNWVMDKWLINLRQNLKEDGHIGFSVTQKSGKVELTHRINEVKSSKNFVV